MMHSTFPLELFQENRLGRKCCKLFVVLGLRTKKSGSSDRRLLEILTVRHSTRNFGDRFFSETISYW